MKVVIFGNSGAGKSTMAKCLADQHDLAHLDLDQHAWLDTQPPQRKPLSRSISAIAEFIAKHSDWVIEGCYADLLNFAMEHADEVRFLNPGIEVCIENCKQRPWEPHKYKTEQEQQANLGMLLNWVREYATRNDEFSLTAHKTLFDEFNGIKREYHRNEDTD